ncbi:MAG: DUF493 domain-containing protein [Ectothiorhodospiraceae bacterium]|jgi:putative lipoic acid-binding regulatory protein
MTTQEESPLTFPCTYPVKAMGRSGIALERTVLEIVAQHAPGVSADDVRLSESSRGSYISVTITFTAESRGQLEAIYRDLQAHESILATL